MHLPGVDWVSLWKIYSRLFLLAYFVAGVPLRIWLARTQYPWSSRKVWLLSCAASVVYLPCIFFTATPAFLPVLLLPTHDAAYSAFMAVPIAVSVGFFAALLDVATLRLLLRERFNRRRLVSLVGFNMLDALVAMLVVFAWMGIHPPEILASLLP